MSPERYIFMTAAFGAAYRDCVTGLIRSFSDHHDPEALLVFTDQQIKHPGVIHESLAGLLAGFPEYYSHGARVNVFKFELFRRVLSANPDTTVVWIDADTSVHAPLPPHLQHGVVNVARLTRDPAPVLAFGNRMSAPAAECASGNLYALPSMAAVVDLNRLAQDRLAWPDANQVMSGDQALLNHFIRLGLHAMRWIEKPGNGILSTGFAWDIRQRANHAGCTEEPATGRLLYRGEPIIVLSTTKEWVDKGLRSGFREFPAPLRRHLRSIYDWSARPVRARVTSVSGWYLTVRAPENLRAVLRRVPGLLALVRALRSQRSG